jgi:hypothetical protein
MDTCAAFTQYPFPCSQRSPEIRTAQAAVRSEIPGQRTLRSPPGFVAPELVAVPHPRWSEIPSVECVYRWKRGVQCLRVVRALPARGSVIAADVGGAGDGKLARGVLHIGGDAVESSTSGAVWHGGWT